ncbi:hypothetical protein [Pseudomonas fluorescens]|uniref:hypothetical protein n=1 Tax=Pseudomonas fluorescens TaxID=294 RepID=UPI0009372276|nr:hypothetical protein [Pseudomonas fluorescens]
MIDQGTGAVAEKTWAQLQQLNAGWQFKQTAADGYVTYPYRARTVPLPSLQQALTEIPTSTPIILDMKALPAAPQVVDCFRANGESNILAIGVNNDDDYCAAACLKIDAVLVDSPREMGR